MYQRDFILRMIEMIGQLIAGIMGRIQKGDYKGAAEAIDEAYADILKQDAMFFHEIPPANLIDVLIGKHQYTHGHLEILAALFSAQGELTLAEGKKHESIGYYEKSEILLQHVVKHANAFSLDQQEKLNYLHKRILELKGE